MPDTRPWPVYYAPDPPAQVHRRRHGAGGAQCVAAGAVLNSQDRLTAAQEVLLAGVARLRADYA